MGKNWSEIENDPEIYHTGDPITADRIQGEPWYSDYQGVCEVMNAGPYPDQDMSFFEEEPDGKQLALEACKKYFVEFPGPPDWHTPDDRQIMRWIESCWMSKPHIQEVKDLFLLERKREGK